MANILGNVYDFLKQTSQNVGSWVSSKLTPSEETKNLLSGKSLSNFYKPGPDAANLIKSVIVEPVARAGMGIALDITKTPQYNPQTGVDKFLYGIEPIKPLSTQYQEAKSSLESAGFKGASVPIAATAVFGGALLDITAPIGGSKKKVAENIAKETSVPVIAKMLRKMNVADDLIEVYARKFASVADPKVIEKGLDTLEGLVSKTNKVGSALSYTDDVLRSGEDIVAQSQKTTTTKEIGKMMTNWYDKYYNIGKFMDDVEKKIGRKLTMEENAYVGARLYSGIGGKIENKLDKLGIVLRQDAKNVDTGALSNYLFNQRAIERTKAGFQNPGGITEDLARKALKELETEIGTEAFKKIEKQAAGVYVYGNDELLKYIYEGGLIDKATYESALKNNQYHVPFDVVEKMIEQPNVNIPTGSKAFSIAKQELIKATKGTELAVDDPLNALIRKTIKTVDLVERNKVAQTLVDIRKLSPEMEDLIVPVGRGTAIPAGFDTINVLRDGAKEVYAVPKEVASAMKRMTNQQVDFLTKTANWGSKALRGGATTFNILFIVPNAIRDFQTATLVSKSGFNVVDWTKGIWEGFKGVAGEYGLKVDDTVYKKYLEDAGKIGGYYSTYLNQVPKTAKDLSKPEWKKLLTLLNPFKLIEEAGRVVEAGPRLGVYQRAISKGLGGRAAGFASREATVDFAKMGDSMRVLNMWTPFINARLQGTVNVGKSIAESVGNPKRMAELSLKIGALAVTPFVATYQWNTTQFPEVWDDIADYEKSNYIIGIYGDAKDSNGNYTQVIKIPKGNFNFFIDPVQDFLEWQRGNTPKLFSTVAMDTLFNVLPLSTTNQGSFMDRVFQGTVGLFPPPLKAVTETGFGKTSYTGKPIVPPSLENVSPKHQYKDSTTIIAKNIGEWLNVSPLKIENAIRTMTGEVGIQALGIAGTVERPGVTTPFVKGFQKRFTQAYGGQKEQTEVKNIKEYQNQMYDRSIIEKRSAQDLLQKLMTSQNPEETQQIISDIGDNEGVKSKLVDLIKNQVIPYTTSLLKSISPPERAKYIYDQIQSFQTQEGAQAFMEEIKNGNLLTQDTKDELRMLMLQPTQ